MKKVIKQNLCKFEPRINWFIDVQGEENNLEYRCPWRGEAEHLLDLRRRDMWGVYRRSFLEWPIKLQNFPLTNKIVLKKYVWCNGGPTIGIDYYQPWNIGCQNIGKF